MFANKAGFLFKGTLAAAALVALLSLGAFFVGDASSRSHHEMGVMAVQSGRLPPDDVPPDDVPPTSVSGAVAAPGYCSSSGGGTSYESINSVSLAPNPGGTMKLTVQVIIANPDGCSAGEPCGTYDSSPEYCQLSYNRS